MLATVALVFAADFRLDDRSVLPSYVLVLLMCVAYALMTNRQIEKSVPLYTVGALLFGVSVAFERALADYLANHIPEDALHLPNAYDAYATVKTLEFAESICIALFLLVFLAKLWGMVTRLGREEPNGLFYKRQGQQRARLCLAALFGVAASVVDAVNAFVRLEINYLWLLALILSIAMLLSVRSCLTEACDEILSRAQADRTYKKRSRDTY